MNLQQPSDRAPGRLDRWILIFSGCVALVPFAAYHQLFARLYWFGDEFDQIDLIDRFGFWRWTWTFFGENFAPLFKLFWGGGLFVFNGSYAAMLTILWLTHAFNVVLLGRLMRTCGLSWTAVFLAQIAFGLPPSNIETLAWSIQWAPMLSVTFMLLALGSFFKSPFGPPSYAYVVSSALCFVRGVLVGPLVAFASLWGEWTQAADGRRRRLFLALGYLLPSIGVGVLISLLASGNHQHMKGHWGEALVFSAWYYCLNPAYSLLSVESWGWRTVVLLGLCKLSLVGWTIGRSMGRQRLLFVLLVAFDLAYAALVGIGRYHVGLISSVASRYQYPSLIGIAPVAGYWISLQWDRIPVAAGLRAVGASVLLALGAIYLCRQWPATLDPYTAARGTESRRILLLEPNPDPHSVPGIPFLEMGRARALIDKYHLH